MCGWLEKRNDGNVVTSPRADRTLTRALLRATAETTNTMTERSMSTALRGLPQVLFTATSRVAAGWRYWTPSPRASPSAARTPRTGQRPCPPRRASPPSSQPYGAASSSPDPPPGGGPYSSVSGHRNGNPPGQQVVHESHFQLAQLRKLTFLLSNLLITRADQFDRPSLLFQRGTRNRHCLELR